MSSRKPLEEKKVEIPVSKPLGVGVDTSSGEVVQKETPEPEIKKTNNKNKKEKKATPVRKQKIGHGSKKMKPRFI